MAITTAPTLWAPTTPWWMAPACAWTAPRAWSWAWVRSRNALGDDYVNAYGANGNLKLFQWHAGLYYSPIKNVELGGELLGGRRITFGGDKCNMTRLNLQARYLFN